MSARMSGSKNESGRRSKRVNISMSVSVRPREIAPLPHRDACSDNTQYRV